jgi:anti-sigma factor RsiW
MDTDFETLSAYVDGELSGEETAGVEARLAVSPSDRATVDELRMLKAMLAAPPRPGLSELQAAGLMRTVRRELGIESAGAPRRRERVLRYLAPAAVGAAAVAALIVVVPRVIDDDFDSGAASDTTQVGAVGVDRTAASEAASGEGSLAAPAEADDAAAPETTEVLAEALAEGEAADTTSAAADVTQAASETAAAAGSAAFPVVISVPDDAATEAGLQAVLASLASLGVTPVDDVAAIGAEQRFTAGFDPALVCELALAPPRAVLAYGYAVDGTAVVVVQLEDGTLEAVAYQAGCTEVARQSG